MFKSLLYFVLPALTAAASHNVDVGMSGLSFSPNVLNANVGDKVHFHFYPGDHAITQSVYGHPCRYSGPNAIYSGFFNPSSGVDSQEFTITIKNNLPIWLYCPQFNHCQDGMAMVINPGSGQTIANYQSRAASAPTSNHPPNVQGGKVGPNHGS